MWLLCCDFGWGLVWLVVVCVGCDLVAVRVWWVLHDLLRFVVCCGFCCIVGKVCGVGGLIVLLLICGFV